MDAGIGATTAADRHCALRDLLRSLNETTLHGSRRPGLDLPAFESRTVIFEN